MNDFFYDVLGFLHKPISKKFTKKILGAIGVCFILITACSNGTSTAKSTAAEKPKEYINITAKDLGNAYVENEVAADKAYKDTYLAVTGTISNIGLDVLGKPYVILKANGSDWSFIWDDNALERPDLQCSFPKSESDAVALLKKDSVVTLKGKCVGKLIYIQLNDCTVALETDSSVSDDGNILSDYETARPYDYYDNDTTDSYYDTPADYSDRGSAKAYAGLILSNSEVQKLNIFLSNFLEAGLFDYSFGIEEEELIKFAIIHNYLNYDSRIDIEDIENITWFAIDEKYITSTIKRFFDMDITLFSFGGCIYINGKIYCPALPALNEGYFSYFAQIDKSVEDYYEDYINVYFEVYEAEQGYELNKAFYEPKSTWSSETQSHASFSGVRGSAFLKRVMLNGEETYQLESMSCWDE